MSTICAISTPFGIGGIAVVRVSGSRSIEIVDSLFVGSRPLTKVAANNLIVGEIRKDGEMLDQVVVSVFRAPHSFTGEDVVEISCHGSLYIQQELLRWLIDAGCDMAAAGEFTLRAFLNGKLGLTEAEAVADLIAAESKAAHDIALQHLKGGVATELKTLRDELLHFTSLIELELDFADHEDLEFADRTELSALVLRIRQHLQQLTDSFRQGNALKNGIPVAIIGATNAGKSTLLNSLLGEDRAIVSDIHGTTRDTIEDTIVLDGILFRVIDTAGIRLSDNEIEKIGIERSKAAAEKADVILLVVDATAPATVPQNIDLQGKKVITLYNKCDLLKEQPSDTSDTLYISAKSGQLSNLRERLSGFGKSYQNSGQLLITNARHYEALSRALAAIRQVELGLAAQLSGDMLAVDLHDCLNAIGEITGEITSQEVLNNIFAHFCIGK